MSRDVSNCDDVMLTHTHARSGFTLIEVLIVLVIVAIITAVAVMAFGHFGRSRREKMIVEEFSQTINAAQQQAIFTPTVLGLAITADGYRYFEYQSSAPGQAAWVALQSRALSHPQVFRRVFDVNVKNIGAFESSSKTGPSIIFLPSGFVTPFVLNLKGDSHHYSIVIKNNGETKMVASEKE